MQNRRSETNFVHTLARSAALSLKEGYYRRAAAAPVRGLTHRSLGGSIKACKVVPLIAEIKFTSPAEGSLRKPGDVERIARSYGRGGVCGISVLTERRHFDGDLRYLPLVKRSAKVPVLMKDIIIDPAQVHAGVAMGADAILLIASIFTEGLAKVSLDEMLASAHEDGLEVLLEAHTEKEFLFALGSGADIVGINNRDLDTLKVSLETTRKLLAAGGARRAMLREEGVDKPVISESGITSRGEMDELRALGADGFLIGSALMKSEDVERRVRSLTGKRR